METKRIGNVLSLFDGMSGGLQALKQAGIKVDNYYASEVDKYAIQIAKKNHPEIIHLGDVTKWREWDLPKIDLLIGGSPCQGFSFAGKQLNFDDQRSALFFEFVNIKEHYKPEKFLLENVRMKQEYQDVISDLLGCEPILINSALVSAQNRKRLYWCNWNVEQPEDKGILLKDIIEGYAIKEKSQTILSTIYKENAKSMIKRNKLGLLVVDREKSHCRDANYFKGGNLKSYFEKNRRQLVFSGSCLQTGEADLIGHDSIKRTYSERGKSPTLTTMGGGHREPKLTIPPDKWRKLTPLECERLQTFPDGYTEGVSNTQRYKMLGNGWTVSVIEHIFKTMQVEKDIQLTF